MAVGGMRMVYEVSLKLNSPAWLGHDQFMEEHVILFASKLKTHGVIRMFQNCICWYCRALLGELGPLAS